MHISGLCIYPIKGCRGIAVDTAAVHDIGLEHDRRYMVVDENNRFVSQREHPAMARIGVTQTATGWALNRVDLPTLRWDPTPSGTESQVQIWKD
ncbi:MAG: MOSC N-terminal beta barrel domain-containing protein, partial [Roseiflexaceae bacterium]